MQNFKMNQSFKYKLLGASLVLIVSVVGIYLHIRHDPVRPVPNIDLLSEQLVPPSSIGNVKRIGAQAINPKLVVREADPVYPADFSDDKILMGASHNVFIGKVISQIGTGDYGVGPETQFEVSVMSNIKGNLQGTVVIDQEGGYVNGVLYVVGGNVSGGDTLGSSGRAGTGYLMQPGSTYLLATRYSNVHNWFTLNAFPTASKLISSDNSLNNDQVQFLIANNPRVHQLETAYPAEVLLSADVASGMTLNSYASTHTPPPLPAPTPTVVDSPTTISNLASVVGSTSTAMTWTTNKPATSQVFFGSNSAMGESVTLNTTLVTTHAMVLSGLTPGNTYYYEAQSADASGTISTSAQQSFTVSEQSSSGQSMGGN